MKVRKITTLVIAAALSGVCTASAVSLTILTNDSTPSARFSFDHAAGRGHLKSSDPSAGPVVGPVEFFTSGNPVRRVIGEDAANPLRAVGTGTSVFENFRGTLNLGSGGGSYVFTGGMLSELDFSDIDHDGEIVGTLPYTYFSGQNGTGTEEDSGVFYAYDFNFGAQNAPQSFTGDFSNGDIHLWMNNWDNVNQTKAQFLAADPNNVARGMDLAIHVPDGGLSAILLGLGICGLGAFKRFARRA